MKQRLTYFDNAKAFLILLVVFGHFVDLVCHSSSGPLLHYSFLIIWSFHMPAFLFIAGLFDHKRDAFPLKRVVEFVAIGFMLKILNILVLQIFPDVAADPSLLSDKNFPWFMFAMAVFLCLCYLLQKIPAPVVMIVALLLSLIAGYFSQIGDFLYLSRILVFFPVYYLGYCLKPDTIASFFTTKLIRILCGIGLLFALIFIALHLEQFYHLRPLFTGRNAYNDWVLSHHGAAMRLLSYAISGIVTFFFLGIIPSKKLPLLTSIGTATLPIYCIHYYPIFLLDGLGILSLLEGSLRVSVLLLLFMILAILEIVLITVLSPSRKGRLPQQKSEEK